MAHTLVTFHAHPDDESLLTAGVMAKAAAEGHRVVLVVATAGELGEADHVFGENTEHLGEVRRGELARSAEILGVGRVEYLGYGDSGLLANGAEPALGSFAAAPIEEAAARLAAILKEERADVLTTYDPNGGYGHPDHIKVHAVGHRAGEIAGTPVVLEATINRDLMTMGLQMAKSLGHELPDGFRPERFENWFMPADALTHAVDVTPFLEQKRASMEAHESQSTTSASSGEQPRSIAMFLALSPEYFAMAFGTEWFIEREREGDRHTAPAVERGGDHGQAPPGGPRMTDVFASLLA